MVAALKGVAYAHFLSFDQYAQINYYLLIVGLGTLLVGSGVIVRCHSEMPLLANDEEKLSEFVLNVKWFGGAFWLVGLVGLIGYGVLSDAPMLILLFSLIQVLVFFVFTIDLMVVKSKKKFVEYAKRLLYRNLLIALAGLCVAFVTINATYAILAEVLVGGALCFRSLALWLVKAAIPSRTFLLDCLKFVPVTCVGAFMQYVDRVFAAYYLSPKDFSRFSYLSLIVVVALSIQQLINTRVITLLPEICLYDPRAGLRYVVRVSFLVCLFLSVALLCLLSLLQSRWFAAEWLDASIEVGAVFLACAILRAADFYTSYLLVMSQKNKLLAVQLCMLGLFFILSIFYNLIFKEGGVFAFVSLMCAGFFVQLLFLIFFSWRASFAEKTI
ncbi:hypothetical protein [Pseudomonas sp. D1-36]|uniref:hypothetical protein n=1 Tax=Pseudomonas sp. D1-36 TaxID=2817387 RepID=UPI003DA8D317